MRHWLFGAAVLALLAPATASAQPYAPRDVYGNLLSVPRYGYPPGYPADGYSDNFPLATRPASRPRSRAVDPMTGYAYGGPPVLRARGRGVGLCDLAAIRAPVRGLSRHANGPARSSSIPPAKYLYLVQPGGRAIRYGIGVGRPGLRMGGPEIRHHEEANGRIGVRRREMLKRRPDLPTYMEGGPDNPLGARALYLGSSLYRIHGTNEPHTIGQAVSSGCIRMLNRDVIDLYRRVPVGAPVVVI